MSKRVERQQPDFDPSSSFSLSLAHTTPTDGSLKSELPAAASSGARNKRRAPAVQATPSAFSMTGSAPAGPASSSALDDLSLGAQPMQPPAKKSRTNTPWTPAEEQRLKNMRDAGNSWADIAKDMHYAEFAEDESQALLAAIKEYEANKWKAIGAKVGKPAKACEQYAKDNFGGKI
ncbi:hypothetical protein CJF32_00003689 [Rutstroemia sp. NJR-2017a WRK4]|nr:hypothetical protein CJF32_00003689 [Rutstroemia sp. NJR-2017a WRK4]